MTDTGSLFARLQGRSLDDLKLQVVSGGDKVPSFGGRANIDEHFEMLRQEFVGQPEILLYHALLVVLIRRKIDLDQTLVRYRELWAAEAAFLVENLDSRWLVSACDTLIDYSPHAHERALAVAAMLFVNTVKLYETERWATEASSGSSPYREISGRVELCDGLTAFMIGRGDMVRNLHLRIGSVTGEGGTAALILDEVVKRASVNDTVFKRFKDVHTRPETLW